MTMTDMDRIWDIFWKTQGRVKYTTHENKICVSNKPESYSYINPRTEFVFDYKGNLISVDVIDK
jgi:hypothetical protein